MLSPEMRQTERLSAILEQLAGDGSVEVTDLADRLGASVATVRRDLQLLEGQRLLDRTHGGAVAHGVMYELRSGTRPRGTRTRSAGSRARPRRGWRTGRSSGSPAEPPPRRSPAGSSTGAGSLWSRTRSTSPGSSPSGRSSSSW